MALTVGKFLDALRTALDAVGGLDGVTIVTGPVGPDEPAELVTLGAEAITGGTGHHTGTKLRLEEYTVPCRIWIHRPGNAEADIKAARDRAEAILALIETALRADQQMSSTVNHCEGPVDFTYSAGATDPPGRWQIIDFTVNVRNNM